MRQDDTALLYLFVVFFKYYSIQSQLTIARILLTAKKWTIGRKYLVQVGTYTVHCTGSS